MEKYEITLPEKIEAMQFNDYESYFKIFNWMKECGDTHALAREIILMTPVMLMPTYKGTAFVNVGDYIIRDAENHFFPISKYVFESVYKLDK